MYHKFSLTINTYVIFKVFVVGKATVKFYSMKIYVDCSRRLVSVLDRQQYHTSLIIKWAWLTKETDLLQDLAKPCLEEVTATVLLNNSISVAVWTLDSVENV